GEQQARDLERAKQAGVYLRDKFMENAPDREMEEAARLGRELLHDLDGPLRISKMRRIEERVEPTVEAQAVADGHDPASLIDRMTSTGAGCEWLLGRWARLAAKGKHWELWGWEYKDDVALIRLMGRQALDVLTDPVLAEVFLASHALDRGRRTPFIDLLRRVISPEMKQAVERLSTRTPPEWDARDPSDGCRRLLA